MISFLLPYFVVAVFALLLLLAGMAIGYRMGKARTQTALVIPGSRDIIIEVSDCRIKPREKKSWPTKSNPSGRQT